MGILKKISRVAEKAERGYQKAKKDSEGIRKTGSKILDWAIPPPKKKAMGKSGGKTVKIGNCTCTCPSKKRKR